MRTSAATLKRVNLSRLEAGEQCVQRPREIPCESMRVLVVAPGSAFDGCVGVAVCERYFGYGADDVLVEVAGRDGTHRLGFAPMELEVTT